MPATQRTTAGSRPGGVVGSLWHFTCHHGFDGIGCRGRLKPNPHPWAPKLGPIVWLTSDPAPDRDDVGLTRGTLVRCDRMAFRYRVRDSDAVPWSEVRDRVPARVVADLESFADPSTWWVATWADVVLA